MSQDILIEQSEELTLVPEEDEIVEQLKELENLPPLPQEEQALVDALAWFMAKNRIDSEKGEVQE